MINDALKTKHPEITVIGTAGPGQDGDDFNKGWKLANDIKIAVVDEHYYLNPGWFIANQNRYDSYNRNGSQVYLGEYASWGNKMRNAISEAAFMISLERNGDVVKMASYAPLLAKNGFTQWKTDLIYFDNVRICPSVNFFIQKMFMTNSGNIYYGNIISNHANDTTLAVSCVRESKTGDVILKVVNAREETNTVKINLSAFKNLLPDAEKTVLEGNADDENSFDNHTNVLPVSSKIKISSKFDYSAPAMSFTVIRIKFREKLALK
jgi:alpha-L-arabinofuranosidase